MIIQATIEKDYKENSKIILEYRYYPLERVLRVCGYTKHIMQEIFGIPLPHTVTRQVGVSQEPAPSMNECKFLDAIGALNKSGNLTDIAFVEVDDE